MASLTGRTTAVAPSELHLFHRNPRRGDVSAVMASLRRHGQYKPITANVGTHTGRPNEVLAGNHTTMAFRDLAEAEPTDARWRKILVHWVDVDDDMADRIVVADNQTGQLGTFDPETLLGLLDGFGTDIDGLGFTAADIDALAALHEGTDSPGGANDDADVPISDPGPVKPKPVPEPRYDGDRFVLHHGDSLESLKLLEADSVDAVVTDPPYGLEFMGREWDAPWKSAGDVVTDPASVGGFQDGNGGNPYSRSRIRFGREGEAGAGFQQWCEQWATECLRVLRPGGHLVAFGGTRTWHRLAAAIEDAGLEMRDSIAWLYGSGFPKSLDVSKAIDKESGAERTDRSVGDQGANRVYQPSVRVINAGTPVLDAAKQWAGWGTALKPAFEPIVVARKPFPGTVAANVQQHGTGALNIDGCRVGSEVRHNPSASNGSVIGLGSPSLMTETEGRDTVGRWPANVCLDGDMADVLDEQSGHSSSRRAELTSTPGVIYGGLPSHTGIYGYDDEGGASRFFPTFRYTAKAPASERPQDTDGTAHPTVKPLDLMRWLVRLVTPPGGVVLEPFAGSGTTVEACLLEGFACVAIEREADYIPLIVQRIERAGANITVD